MGCVGLGDARSRELVPLQNLHQIWAPKNPFFFFFIVIIVIIIIINRLSWSPSIVSLMMDAPPSHGPDSPPVIDPSQSNETSISNCTSSSSSSSSLVQDASSNASCKDAVALAPQSIVVALRIRPLTASEHKQGCKDCITVIPGEPQVYIISNPISVIPHNWVNSALIVAETQRIRTSFLLLLCK